MELCLAVPANKYIVGRREWDDQKFQHLSACMAPVTKRDGERNLAKWLDAFSANWREAGLVLIVKLVEALLVHDIRGASRVNEHVFGPIVSNDGCDDDGPALACASADDGKNDLLFAPGLRIVIWPFAGAAWATLNHVCIQVADRFFWLSALVSLIITPSLS